MYHLRLKGEHYQMGVKRGKIFQKCNITFPLHLDDFQMKYGRESERILKGYFSRSMRRNTGYQRYHRRGLYNLCFMAFMYGLLYV